MNNPDEFKDNSGPPSRSTFRSNFRQRKKSYLPWWQPNDPASDLGQLEYHLQLKTEEGFSIADTAFISKDSLCFADYLEVGARSWTTGGAIVRGFVIVGEDVSINAYAHIEGKVWISNKSRIAGGVQIIGFNHHFDDPSVPIKD